MDQFPQAALVAAIGHSPGKHWLNAAAQAAARLTARTRHNIGRKQPLSTNRAKPAGNWQHGRYTLRANGKTRNVDQRLAANTAIGGKQDREETPGNS